MVLQARRFILTSLMCNPITGSISFYLSVIFTIIQLKSITTYFTSLIYTMTLLWCVPVVKPWIRTNARVLVCF